jgi:hypothetical protein
MDNASDTAGELAVLLSEIFDIVDYVLGLEVILVHLW